MENTSKTSFHYLITWITQIWQNVHAKAEHIIENPNSIFQHLWKLQRKLFTQYQPYAVSASIFTVTFAWSYFCYRKQLAIQLQNKALNNTSHYQIEQSDENQLSGQFFRKHVIQLTKDTQHGVPIQLTTNSIIQEAQMQEEIDKQDKYFFSVYQTYMKTDSQRR